MDIRTGPTARAEPEALPDRLLVDRGGHVLPGGDAHRAQGGTDFIGGGDHPGDHPGLPVRRGGRNIWAILENKFDMKPLMIFLIGLVLASAPATAKVLTASLSSINSHVQLTLDSSMPSTPSRRQLRDILGDLANYSKDQLLYVKVDETVTAADLVRAVSDIQSSGLHNVVLMTSVEERGKRGTCQILIDTSKRKYEGCIPNDEFQGGFQETPETQQQEFAKEGKAHKAVNLASLSPVYPNVSESVARLSSTNENVQERGIRDLIEIGKSAAPAYDFLISIALSSNTLPKFRSGAADALRNIDETKASQQFIQELTNSSPAVREYAVDALMIIRRPEAALPLYERLRDESQSVRSRAGIALQFYKDSLPPELLIATLAKKDDKAREWAPWLLGCMHCQSAVEPLQAQLDDDDPNFRKSVVASLRAIRSKASVEPLIKVVRQDRDEDVRMQAIQVLGELRDPKASELLLELLNDPNPEIRTDTIGAIGALGIEEAKPRLRKILKQEMSRETLSAMGALCRMHDTNAIPLIVDHLSTNDETVTYYCMQGLVELGAEDELLKLQQRENPRIRAAAEKALLKLKKRKNPPTKATPASGESPQDRSHIVP